MGGVDLPTSDRLACWSTDLVVAKHMMHMMITSMMIDEHMMITCGSFMIARAGRVRSTYPA
jgi:hypothetical protein